MSDIISSLLSTIRSILSTFYHGIESAFVLVQSSVMSVIDLAGGVLNFVLGHIVVIGVLIAAYVGYTAYAQKNQPGSISKKRN